MPFCTYKKSRLHYEKIVWQSFRLSNSVNNINIHITRFFLKLNITVPCPCRKTCHERQLEKVTNIFLFLVLFFKSSMVLKCTLHQMSSDWRGLHMTMMVMMMIIMMMVKNRQHLHKCITNSCMYYLGESFCTFLIQVQSLWLKNKKLNVSFKLLSWSSLILSLAYNIVSIKFIN